MEPIILASGSLRRQDYFRMLGLPFSIIPTRADESPPNELPALDRAEAIARRKIDYVLKTLENRLPGWILGADTLIVVDGEVFGKPADKEAARAMLQRLSGRSHQVATGMALYVGREKRVAGRSSISEVRFATLSEAEIAWYLDSGEWQGVAGGYRIQGLAGCFVSEIRGSFSSIVGLPMHEFYVMLRKNGYPFGAPADS
jgi:septum formation protein